MKKLILLFCTIFITNNVNAQWELRNDVDEFGEKTSKTFKSLTAEGTFSNTATQNSEALYYFADKGDAILINVYEYKSSLATSTDNTFELVKIRKKGGDTSYLEGVLFSKGGSLYFDGRLYNQLKKVIKNTGDYIMIFEKTGEYSSSNYKVNFSITNDDDTKEVKDDLVFEAEPFKLNIHNSFLNEIEATATYSTKKVKKENVDVKFYGDSKLKMFIMSFKNYGSNPPKIMKKSIFEKIKIQIPINYSVEINAFISDNNILVKGKDYDRLIKALNYLGKYKLELKSKKLKFSYNIEFNL